MLITYETASMLLQRQSIVHIVSSEDVDALATVSILRRFLLMRLIPFTLTYGLAQPQEEGFHIFINAEVTTHDALVILSRAPVPIEYVVSRRIQVLDDGLALLEFLQVFDSKRLGTMFSNFYRHLIRQETSEPLLKEPDEEFHVPSQSLTRTHRSTRPESRNESQESQHPRILRIIQENNLIFAKKPVLPQQEDQPQHEESEPYSIDLDEESSEEEQSAGTMSDSMQRFVIETEESEQIDIDIHRRLYNQQEFEDSEMASTELARLNNQQEEEEEEEAVEEELLSGSETGQTSATNQDKLRQLTEQFVENPAKVHPILFFLDFEPDINQEQLDQLYERVRKMRQSSVTEQYQELLEQYEKEVTHGFPCAFRAALTVLAVASGVDISDKNFADQVIFSSFVGGIAQYEQHFTDIATIQHYRSKLRNFVVEQGQEKTRGRPWITFTDYNIRGLRLVPLFNAIEISALKNIVRYSNFSVQEVTAKANHTLAKLGVKRTEAEAVFVTLDKNMKRVFKKNYYELSQPYKNEYEFYVPNFVYQHSSQKSIEISAQDVVCLLLADPRKYVFMDFHEIAFLVQKSVISMDGTELEDVNYPYFKAVERFLERQLFLENELQFLRLVYDAGGLCIYNIISDHEFDALDLENLSAMIRQEKVMQDYLAYNKKAPNALLQELYEHGKVDSIPTLKGCKFIKARFKPVDMMAEDCVVCVFGRERCYVNYAKSGFLGGIVGQYVQDAEDWQQLNCAMDSSRMGQIQKMFDAWKSK